MVKLTAKLPTIFFRYEWGSSFCEIKKTIGEGQYLTKLPNEIFAPPSRLSPLGATVPPPIVLVSATLSLSPTFSLKKEKEKDKEVKNNSMKTKTEILASYIHKNQNQLYHSPTEISLTNSSLSLFSFSKIFLHLLSCMASTVLLQPWNPRTIISQPPSAMATLAKAAHRVRHPRLAGTLLCPIAAGCSAPRLFLSPAVRAPSPALLFGVVFGTSCFCLCSTSQDCSCAWVPSLVLCGRLLSLVQSTVATRSLRSFGTKLNPIIPQLLRLG